MTPRKRNPNSLISLENTNAQAEDTKVKYKEIQAVLRDVVLEEVQVKKVKKINWLDKLVVHPIWGYALFLFTLMFLFQLIFTIASYPMDLIDNVVGVSANWMKSVLPAGVFTDLLTNGIVPGVGGVLIFIPQITLLFFFLGILEETGYMSRVVFIMDRLMRPFGLNGKSIVPLLSSAACAIPGIMASRSIANWKERLITILVAPLVSCSARIPVYTLLISLVIPPKIVFGFLSLQGMVFFLLYALGIISALMISLVLKWIIRSKETSTLLLEIPEFKSPRWKNIGITVWDKVRIFVFDAGKIIVAISIILWALGSYGPSKRMKISNDQLKENKILNHWTQEEFDRNVEAARFENSYIGIVGKSIEPIIRPLGYDWKIGVSLITSFAAREVFVGSMATIYSVQADNNDTSSLRERMLNAKNSQGGKIYTLASGLSLLVFYVYAMQCMATFAVVKRETKSWKWPFIQLIFMGILAYGSSYFIFHIFS
jgi:ferrous iron transport protein B